LRLATLPLTRDDCNAFVDAHHRHHEGVTGYRYGIGARLGTTLVGCAVVGRPRARLIDQELTVEVTRCCTDGTPHVCSFLYGACARLAKLLGFAAIFTCILRSEAGTSLRAAGWRYVYTTRGGTQNRPSRPRVDKSPTEPKQVWAPPWCAVLVGTFNKQASEHASLQETTHAR
jgi:hypothetical protein